MQINYARYLDLVLKYWILAEQNPAYSASVKKTPIGRFFT